MASPHPPPKRSPFPSRGRLKARPICYLTRRLKVDFHSKKETAWNFQSEHVKFTKDINEITDIIEAGNIAAVNWCGDEECGKQIEEKTGYDVLGIYKDAEEGAKCIVSGNDAKYVALIAKTY